MKSAETKAVKKSSHTASPHLGRRQRGHFFSFSKKSNQPFFGPKSIQPKLKIGQPNDKYEQEADRVADEVMNMPTPQLQRQSTEEELQMQPLEEEEELQMQRHKESPIQRKCEECEEEEQLQQKPVVQRSEDGSSYASDDLYRRLQRNRGYGTALPENARSEFGSKMSSDFSDVKIHTDHKAVQMSREIGARAFTHGKDIYFNRGEFNTDTRQGKHLLAHELVHVVQQRSTKPSGSVQRAVDAKKVSCAEYAADHPTIKVIGTPDPLSVIKNANARSLVLLDKTIGMLEYVRGRVQGGAPASYPTFSDCMGTSLKIRFKMDPEKESTWTGSGKTGTLVKWYKKIKEILSGSTLSYTCIDVFADCGLHTWGSSIPGQFRIYLCKPFWYDSLDNQALTLIHETSHIYYDTDDYIGSTIMNAHCLEKFVAETNNVPISAEFESGCGGKNDFC